MTPHRHASPRTRPTTPHSKTSFAALLRLAGCSSALWIAATSGAQTAVSANSGDNSDSVVTLSPFVVNTQKDVGFVASSSLAGGRLAGDLKDTPAAYSVQTREFLDALNIVDLSQAAEWGVNIVSTRDNGANEVFGSVNQIAFRGGSNAATQRDFFPFAVNYDSYNLERIDYARGPNAILFGNGDYSGTINAVSRFARTDRTFGDLKLSYGSWENLRVTTDTNVARNNFVALRLDTVFQDRAGWRDFEKERRKAATLSATFNLTHTTQLRLQAEGGLISRNNPFTTFNDRFSGWDGVTTLAARIPTTGVPSGATAQGYTQYGNATTPVFVYSPAFGDTLDLSRTAQTLGAGGSTPLNGVLVVGPSANIASQVFNEALNLPADRFARAIAGSQFRYPNRNFAVSTNNPSFKQRFRSFSGFLTQSIGDTIFTSVDGNISKQSVVTEYENSRGTPFTYIDINQNLPDGRANPEFLQPYNEGYRLSWPGYTLNKAVRASLAWVPKPTPFGEFSFNAAWQHNRSETYTDPHVYVVKRNADPRLWSNSSYNDAVMYRYYWDDNHNFPTPEVSSVNYNGTTYPAGWVKDIANSSSTPGYTYRNLDTLQAAGRAKLFKGRIHLLAAIRHDAFKSENVASKLPGDYPADWDGTYYVFRPKAPSDYGTLTYVPKDANGNPTGAARPAITRPRSGIFALPQYANDRFQDDFSAPDVKANPNTYSLGGVAYLTKTLSGYYNYATTFNPAAARQNIYGVFFPEQTAAEWSVGVRDTLANGKLAVSLGYYNGRQSGGTFDQGLGLTTNLNNIALASPTPDTGSAPASGQGNKEGMAPVPRFFDSRNVINHGFELELVANPTKSWRITLNAAMPRAYQTNTAPDFRRYMADNDATMRKILADTSVIINPTTGLASVDTTVPTTRRSPDAQTAASAWNSLQSTLANLVTGNQPAQRMPLYSGNLFTDYTFRQGTLRGLRVGGGINYRSRQIIGFKGGDTIRDPSNPSQAIDDPNVGPLDPVYFHGYTAATAVVGYDVKWIHNLPMRIDLKVDNLFDYDKPLYVSTVQRPVGGDITNPARVATPYNFYYLTPRTYTLTVTMKY